MEKVSSIFSILTHNYEFMMWFWLLATLPLGIWPLFFSPSKKILSEKELTEISSGFKGINSAYTIYSIVAIILLIALPLFVLAPSWNKWALQKFGIEFYPSVVFLTAGYGIYQSLFALVTGVYPMGRFLTYAYEAPAKIRQIAKRHLLISIAAIVFIVLFFFVTV